MGVRLVKLNWDEECELDFITGKGFEITESAFKSKQKRSKYGIQSPLFSSDWSDDDAFAERYSCECGALRGRIYDTEECDICGSAVRFKDVDLKITGWIKLGEYSVIHPIFYRLLMSVIGEKAFLEIIEYDKDITRNGHMINKHSARTPFKGIGISGFKERFEEIMNYYKDRKKNKLTVIDEIYKDKEMIFTSSIPVYSSVLRPSQFKGESFFFNSMDKKYNPIVNLAKLIKDKSLIERRRNKDWSDIDENKILTMIQKKLIELCQLIFKQIDQRKGHIKWEVLGGKINYSARNVVIPDPELKANEVKLGYLTFLELYKYEIIAHIVKINNVSEHVAYEYWYKGTISYNNKLYEIMKYLLKKLKPRLLINRNPTINYGSILLMKIASIKNTDVDEYTMSLPIQILTVLNADQLLQSRSDLSVMIELVPCERLTSGVSNNIAC